MLAETYWQYEHLKEDGKIEVVTVNKNDFDAKITGKYVFGVKEYFDENPEEAKRLGWVKHIMHNVDKWVQYNKQTQYLRKSRKIIDEYTYEDEYHVMEKTEDMMRREEESAGGDWITYSDSGIFWEVD